MNDKIYTEIPILRYTLNMKPENRIWDSLDYYIWTIIRNSLARSGWVISREHDIRMGSIVKEWKSLHTIFIRNKLKDYES